MSIIRIGNGGNLNDYNSNIAKKGLAPEEKSLLNQNTITLNDIDVSDIDIIDIDSSILLGSGDATSDAGTGTGTNNDDDNSSSGNSSKGNGSGGGNSWFGYINDYWKSYNEERGWNSMPDRYRDNEGAAVADMLRAMLYGTIAYFKHEQS